MADTASILAVVSEISVTLGALTTAARAARHIVAEHTAALRANTQGLADLSRRVTALETAIKPADLRP